jgi:hypothetical protein
MEQSELLQVAGMGEQLSRSLPTHAEHEVCACTGELSGDNIEVAVVGEDRKFRVLTPAEVQDYLQEVE